MGTGHVQAVSCGVECIFPSSCLASALGVAVATAAALSQPPVSIFNYRSLASRWASSRCACNSSASNPPLRPSRTRWRRLWAHARHHACRPSARTRRRSPARTTCGGSRRGAWPSRPPRPRRTLTRVGRAAARADQAAERPASPPSSPRTVRTLFAVFGRGTSTTRRSTCASPTPWRSGRRPTTPSIHATAAYLQAIQLPRPRAHQKMGTGVCTLLLQSAEMYAFALRHGSDS
jgi:hypothetical protein